MTGSTSRTDDSPAALDAEMALSRLTHTALVEALVVQLRGNGPLRLNTDDIDMDDAYAGPTVSWLARVARDTVADALSTLEPVPDDAEGIEQLRTRAAHGDAIAAVEWLIAKYTQHADEREQIAEELREVESLTFASLQTAFAAHRNELAWEALRRVRMMLGTQSDAERGAREYEDIEVVGPWGSDGPDSIEMAWRIVDDHNAAYPERAAEVRVQRRTHVIFDDDSEWIGPWSQVIRTPVSTTTDPLR